MSGRDKPACCRERCLSANHPFPPDPEASTVTIFKNIHTAGVASQGICCINQTAIAMPP
jgi:hypothetical protein